MLLLQVIIAVSVLLGLFILSLVLKIFDSKGSVAALILGAWVAFLGSDAWLILMVLFAASSYVATRAFFRKKRAINLQEGSTGERGPSNILFAGIIGAAIALFYYLSQVFRDPGFPYFELFAISFAVINADTFASELGSLDRKVYMITTFKKTVPGANGGVSLTGTAASGLGGFLIGIFFVYLNNGYFLVWPVVFITAMGTLGSAVDSVLGDRLENRNIIGKGMVNFLASLVTVSAAVLLLLTFPVLG
ncbi:MAG: DUF92 domain-containing protein [Candidatus Thermoplasmatota archaeon]|nr:DUF92 domain-containing protein [Candidatus Thermoplasmatota archaeon]